MVISEWNQLMVFDGVMRWIIYHLSHCSDYDIFGIIKSICTVRATPNGFIYRILASFDHLLLTIPCDDSNIVVVP